MAKYCGEHVVCCVTGNPGADLHHILSRKAHPKFKDERWNMIPVSHSIHMMIHQRGLTAVSREILLIKNWLIENGYEFDEYMKRWFHPLSRGEEI